MVVVVVVVVVLHLDLDFPLDRYLSPTFFTLRATKWGLRRTGSATNRGGFFMYFKKLDVYQLAIEHFTLAQQLISVVPPGYREVREQLRRAALSIPLNVAEGAGKTSPADQRRFFAIARGSAMECAALVDVCGVLGIGEEGTRHQADVVLLSLVRMLSKMSIERAA